MGVGAPCGSWYVPVCVGYGRGWAVDFLLSLSSFLILVVGSTALVKCIRKKVEKAAKMGKKLRASRSNDDDSPVDPSAASTPNHKEEKENGKNKTGTFASKLEWSGKRNKSVKVHPVSSSSKPAKLNDGITVVAVQKSKSSVTAGKGAATTLTREEAATKLQGMYRRMKARRRIRWMISNIFEKVVDERSGAFYYYNKRTGTSSWTKPALMKGNDDLEMTPRSKATADQLRKKASQRGKR